MIYSGKKLLDLLEIQHQKRSISGLFRRGQFTLNWRAKVGSFPHPDLETIISAGEPCGSWRTLTISKERKVNGRKETYTVQSRPEDKRNVGENWQALKELPLNGYIPATSIRGIVRAWAKQRPDIYLRMIELLGYQENDRIQSGKIQFLDAWPTSPCKLHLDIVNPQQEFQVFHQGQGTPLSCYTLGDGQSSINFEVAIRGIPGCTTPEEVDEVWSWVQQALKVNGVGSRTASGYGDVSPPSGFQSPQSIAGLASNYGRKTLYFDLYSQGNSGPNIRTMELRPSHWRGWLRSWLLRFFLGIMSVKDAKDTVDELMGTLEPKSVRGVVKLTMQRDKIWGEKSGNSPYFYQWQGRLELTAPAEILQHIILPIVRFAVSVGGVGRGWRRPLHIFMLQRPKSTPVPTARGCYLTLKQKVRSDVQTVELPLRSDSWERVYTQWYDHTKTIWPERVLTNFQNPKAEAFSPLSCAVYAVAGLGEESIDLKNRKWTNTDPPSTRGEGIDTIYESSYKRNQEVGGNAGKEGAYCSYVSIRRCKLTSSRNDNREVVCLFLAAVQPEENNHLRIQFLKDIAHKQNAIHLFGVSPKLE